MSAQVDLIAVEQFTTFGDLLKFLRRRTGLTQRELSIAVGYSEAQISRLEKNERMPDVATIAARFLPVLHLVDRAELADRLLDLAAAARREDAPAAGLPPYKGLLFFDETDADSFFGREALVDDLVSDVLQIAVKGPRFLAVIGASGSGKSSVVRAGMIPSLRWREPSSGWLISVLTPTSNPVNALSAGLLVDTNPGSPGYSETLDLAGGVRALHDAAVRICRSAGAAHFLLVVDQFEETFTLCRSQETQQAFVDNLLYAADRPDGPVCVIIVMRADFYAHCARFDRLREALAERQVYLGPMTHHELRRAIEEPARAASWELEPGLTDLLLADVGADEGCRPEPGALPLLSHALLETWQRRRGRTLTLSGYTASGGVRGAITETAEAVYYDQLDPPAREIARQIFLRLTELGGDSSTADTRRRVNFAELAFQPADRTGVQSVLQVLADARLVTLSRDTAEVAHEALIRAWPTLRNWLEEDRESLRLQRQLTEAAQEWERTAHDSSGMFRGARLARALEWWATHPYTLNDLEIRFLEESRREAAREAAEVEAQRLRELEAARRLAETEREHARVQTAALARSRRLSGFLIGAVLLVGALAVVTAVFGRQVATTQRLSDSRLLAAAAVNNLSIDPERSVLLALEALKIAETTEARKALHQALPELHILHIMQAHQSGAVDVAFSPDDTLVASIGEDRTAKIWDTATGALLQTLHPGNDQYSSGVAFSPDGALLATGWETQVIVWDVARGEMLHTITGESTGTTVGYNLNVGQVRFSSDGRYFAAANIDGRARVWETGMWTEVMTLVPEGPPPKALDFSADGRFIATGDDVGMVTVWDAGTGEKVGVYALSGIIHALSFAPDGTRFAAGSEDGSVKVWDAASGEELLKLPRQIGMYDIDFMSGDRLVTAGQDGATRIYDAATGELLLTLAGHVSTVVGVAGSTDGRLVATSGYDSTVRIWDTGPGHEALTLKGHTGIVWEAVYSPDGRRIASAGADGLVRLWDSKTGAPGLIISGPEPAWTSIAFSPNGRTLAAGGFTGSVVAWDVETGSVVYEFRAHETLVSGLAFSPDGARLAAASWDGTGTVWDLPSGSSRKLRPSDGSLTAMVELAFSPDGKELFTSGGYVLRRWDPVTGAELEVYPENEKEFYSVAVNADGTRFATGDQDGVVQVWDMATGGVLKSMTGHAGLALRLNYSPDGTLLVSAAFDRLAKVWDAETGEEIFSLFGNASNVFSAAFSPGGKEIVTGGADGTVRTYVVDLSELVKLAEARLSRQLTEEECRAFLRSTCP